MEVTLSLLGNILADDIWKYFSKKMGFDIFPQKTFDMKCQYLFSGKNKKNILKFDLLKLLPTKLSINAMCSKRDVTFQGFFSSSGSLLLVYEITFVFAGLTYLKLSTRGKHFQQMTF